MLYSGKSDLTKRALAESLKCCMSQKPLNKVSVREITESCGLNRQTFYYHFQDIYELLEWMINQEIVSVIGESDQFQHWQDAAIYLLRYIRQNEALSLCILHSVGRESLRRFFYKDVHSIATRFLKENLEGIEFNEQDLYYLTDYYTISFAGLLEDWVTGGMKRSPEESIHILETIVAGTARQAMERFSQERNT